MTAMQAHPTAIPTSTLPASLRGNFVLLRADTLRLLLPQSEVGAAGYLDTRPEPTAQAGLLRLPGPAGERHVAALSAHMTLLPACPAERFIVATLGDSGEGLEWCWDELRVLINIEVHAQPIAALLLAPHTPVTHYAELGGELAYLCNADQVKAYALNAEHAT